MPFAGAYPAFAESVAIFQPAHDRHLANTNRIEMGHALRLQGRCAAQLFGAAKALRERIGSSMEPNERREYEPIVAQLRAQTDAATLTAAWARGRAQSLDEAVAYALDKGDS